MWLLRCLWPETEPEVQVTGMLTESVPEVVIVTLPIYQPLLPSAPAAESEADGLLLSSLKVWLFRGSLLPALSLLAA